MAISLVLSQWILPAAGAYHYSDSKSRARYIGSVMGACLVSTLALTAVVGYWAFSQDPVPRTHKTASIFLNLSGQLIAAGVSSLFHSGIAASLSSSARSAGDRAQIAFLSCVALDLVLVLGIVVLAKFVIHAV